MMSSPPIAPPKVTKPAVGAKAAKANSHSVPSCTATADPSCVIQDTMTHTVSVGRCEALEATEPLPQSASLELTAPMDTVARHTVTLANADDGSGSETETATEIDSTEEEEEVTDAEPECCRVWGPTVPTQRALGSGLPNNNDMPPPHAPTLPRPELTHTAQPTPSKLLQAGTITPEMGEATLMKVVGDAAFVTSMRRGLRLAHLHPWQVDAISILGAAPDDHAMIVAPTSAGKSAVALTLMGQTVMANRSKHALWVTPLVAQAEEVCPMLAAVYAGVHMEVEGLYGTKTKPLGEDASITVMTLEKASAYANRALDGGRAGDLSIAIIDEVHLIGDPSRGPTLELLLTKLTRLTGCRVVSMSATFANADQLSAWLGARLYIAPLDARPVNLEETAVVPTKGLMRHVPMEAMAGLGLVDGHQRCLVKKVTGAGSGGVSLEPLGPAPTVDVGVFTDPAARLRVFRLHRMESQILTYATDRKIYHNPAFGETLATLRDGAHEGGALVFCSSKREAESVAQHIAQHAALSILTQTDSETDFNSSSQSLPMAVQSAVEQFRDLPTAPDPTLVAMIPHGVAFHHAGLSDEERVLVVDLFRSGVIRVICCTPTLATGVNLPSAMVVIYSPFIGPHPLDSTRYRQIVGRAGRFGLTRRGTSRVLCPPAGHWGYPRLVSLMGGALGPVASAIVGQGHPNGQGQGQGQGHLTQAVLEAVAFGGDDVHGFIGSTFLSHLASTPEAQAWLTAAVDRTIASLGRFSFLDDGAPTKLGRAAVHAGVSPILADELYRTLDQARRRCRLDDPLFLLFHIAPTFNRQAVLTPHVFRPSHSTSLRGRLFHHISTMPDGQFAMIVDDILAPFIESVTADSNHPASAIMAAHGAVGVISWALGTPPHGTPSIIIGEYWDSLWPLLAALHRLYVALLLSSLIEERPLDVIIERLGYSLVPGGRSLLSRGDLQRLMREAGQSCAIIATFCKALSWPLLEAVIRSLGPRLEFGVQPALLDLVAIPGLLRHEARKLYRYGMTTPGQVAAGGRDRVYRAISSGLPFSVSLDGRAHLKRRAGEIVAASVAASPNGPVIEEAPDGSYLLLNEDLRVAGAAVAPGRPGGEILPYQVLRGKGRAPEGDRVEAARAIIHQRAGVTQEHTQVTQSQKDTETDTDKDKANTPQVEPVDEFVAQVILDEPVPPNTRSDLRLPSGPTFPVPTFPPPPITAFIADTVYPAPETIKPGRFTVIEYSTEKQEFYHEAATVIDDILRQGEGSVYSIALLSSSPDPTVAVCGGSTVHIFKCHNPSAQLQWVQAIAPLLTSTRHRKSVMHFINSSSGFISSGLPLPVPPLVDPAVAAWMLDVNVIHKDDSLTRTVRVPVDMTWRKLSKLFSQWVGGATRNDGVGVEVYDAMVLGGHITSELDRRGLLPVHDRLLAPFMISTSGLRCRGVPIDTEIANNLLQTMAELRKANASDAAAWISDNTRLDGTAININSVDDLRRVLFSETEGVGFIPAKYGRKTKAGLRNPSTDKESLKLLRGQAPIPDADTILDLILNDRRLKKIAEMVSSPLGQIPTPHDRFYRLPAEISLCRTFTGRLVFDKPNYQQFAKTKSVTVRSEVIDSLRASGHFIPTLRDAGAGKVEVELEHRSLVSAGAGKVLLAVDYNQLELRLLAHLAGDSKLGSLFSHSDPFRMFAAMIFKKGAPLVTTAERDRAKRSVYALVYGQGLASMARAEGITVQEAGQFLASLFAEFPRLKVFRERVCRFMLQHGEVSTLLGRARPFWEAVWVDNDKLTDQTALQSAFREAINSTVQGSAADVVMSATLLAEEQIQRAGLAADCCLLLNMHDELIWEVSEGAVAEAALVVRQAMEGAVRLTVPLVVKCSVGKRWSDLRPMVG